MSEEQFQSTVEINEQSMGNESDDYEDEDDEEILRYDDSIKQQGESSNSTVQQSMKHFQPANKMLSK